MPRASAASAASRTLPDAGAAHRALLALPIDSLDKAALHRRLHAIGREGEGATPMAQAQQAAADRAETR
jgi:hypothetical protein